MRIERVTAHAFGPLSDEELDLAPGMSVIVGPNEAGKSTWHAAIRAALCGLRRGRGRATAADAAFAERHRPWDRPERWAVEARLSLDDGRVIEMSQDLAGKVACRARDVGLGRDVSSEIMDGTPDASRWLGLDRDAFAATVCVDQADIVAVADRETASSLQEHMQRAASTRGTDATAAEARDRLTSFRRERVGIDRANARGPLRAARQRRDAAEKQLDEARRRHAAHLEASAGVEEAGRALAAASQRLAVVEAARARQVADDVERRAERATALAARHASEPQGPAARDEQADLVASALDAWASRRPMEPLAGLTSDELRAEMEALPAAPDGDTRVHVSTADARRGLDLALQSLELHGPRPVAPDDATDGPSEQALRSVARRLRAVEPEIDPRLEAEVAAAHEALTASRGPDRGSQLILMGAGALMAAAVLAVVLGFLVAAGVLAVVAAGAGAWGSRRAPVSLAEASQRVARAEAAIAPSRAARDHAHSERTQAEAEAASVGLPIDADALDALADAQADAERAQLAIAEWDARRAELEERCRSAAHALAEALTGRGEVVSGDPAAAYEAYAIACERRAERARAAAAREPLGRALDARLAAEAAARDAAESVERALATLRAAATAVGASQPDNSSPDELVATLEEWRTRRSEQLSAAAQAMAEWQELIALLDGGTLEQLAAARDERAARAELLAAGVDPDELARLATRSDLELLLDTEREERTAAERVYNSRVGALEQMRRDLPDVAEHEERLAEANAELSGVEGLANVIDETLRLLRAAEEQVHRDLAPILSAAIRRWLPRVSGGRYVDATVDPADLSVAVKESDGGQWRRAMLLSAGAREQIYLLLRVAMAQHLVVTGETAPLLLDEVTAQADRERRRALLEMLHAISAERQVILFTHDQEVAAWAERALDRTRDRLVYLEQRALLRRPMLVAS